LASKEAWPRLSPLVGAEPSRVVGLNQVHGREVVTIERGIDHDSLAALQLEPASADALVSNATDVALVIRAADCVPLLMADRRTGAVAAVHAGWRGTAAGAAVAALTRMTEAFGTNPVDVVAAIGPSIGECCYDVGPELVDAFANAGHARYLIDRWFLAPPPPRGGGPRPKMRLDVPGSNRDQLILAGVPEEQVYLSGLCTAMRLDVFTSYRAEREQAGRLAGVIRAAR
jgi:YfiH family protein